MPIDGTSTEKRNTAEPTETNVNSPEPDTPRRRFLQAVGGAGIVGLAGLSETAAGKQSDQNSGEELTLVDDGEPQGVILHWSTDDDPVAEFAASELHDYIAEMAGEDVPVQEVSVTAHSELDTATSGLVVLTGEKANRYHGSKGKGSSKIPVGWVKSVDRALADTKPDSFAVRTEGQRMTLAGSTHRGTLYSAYEFLEHQGIRFFAPDFVFYKGNTEQIPSQSTILIDSLNLVEEPSMEYRRKYIEEGWSHTEQNLPKLIDWMAKNRHNILVYPTDYANFGNVRWDKWREQLIPELEKRGMQLEVGGHGFNSYLTQEEYGDEYPEWFFEEYNVFDVSNEEAVQTYIDEVITYLEERPEVDIFDAWPPDTATWPPSASDKFGSIANAYASVINQLNEEVSNSLSREVEIEALAYGSHKLPPDSDYMFDESIIIDFAPYDRSYAAPISSGEDYDFGFTDLPLESAVFPRNSSEELDTYPKLFNQWSDVSNGTFAFYEYYRKYLWHSLPVVIPDIFSQDIPYYGSLGDGLGIYSEPADWIPYELNHLLVARMSWNTGLDVDTYVKNYLQDRYGPVAKEMRIYIDLMEENGRLVWDGTRDNMEDLTIVSTVRNNYLKAKNILESAENKVDNQNTTDLVKSLRLNVEYSIADTEIEYYDWTGEEKKKEQANQRLKELINEYKFDGIILKSQWTADQLGDRSIPKSSNRIRELYRNKWSGDETDDKNDI